MKNKRKSLDESNIVLVAILVIVVIALIVVFIPDKKEEPKNQNLQVISPEEKVNVQEEVNELNVVANPQDYDKNVTVNVVATAGHQISQTEAAEIAVKQFSQLGEPVKADELRILDLERDGEDEFYITSKNNTMEIRKRDGKITRLNAVPQ